MDAAGDGLRVEPSWEGRSARLALVGEVDAATAPLLDEHIVRALERGCVEVVLHCAELDFIDSSGLSVIVTNHKRLQASGGTLVIEAPAAPTRRLFDISGLGQVLTIR